MVTRRKWFVKNYRENGAFYKILVELVKWKSKNI